MVSEWCGRYEGLFGVVASRWSQVKDNQGKGVHLKYKGARLEKIGKGDTRVPEFEVKTWREMTDRPPVKEEAVVVEDANPDLPDDEIPF